MHTKLAIGIDVIDFDDINRLINLKNGANKYFTAKEIAKVSDKSKQGQLKSLAGRFAIKEAAVKALGTGFTGNIKATEIETLNAPSGKPILILYGSAKALFNDLGFNSSDVSIAYSKNTATAIVMFF